MVAAAHKLRRITARAELFPSCVSATYRRREVAARHTVNVGRQRGDAVNDSTIVTAENFAGISSGAYPKVSVLVTTYNHERYVRRALDTVFAQEMPFPAEVIIGDDSSTDGTWRIVEEFAARYPSRVRAYRLEKNAEDFGIRNFLLGLEMCRGTYIAALDGDDYWSDETKLQRQAALLDARPGYLMCFHGCSIEYEGGDHQPWDARYTLPKESVALDELLRGPMVQTSTMVMRRQLASSIIRRHDLPKLKDWFIGLIACRSGPIGYIDRVMSVWWQHSSSVYGSLSPGAKSAEFVNFYEYIKEEFGNEFRDVVETEICVNAHRAAMWYESTHDLASAKQYLLRAQHGEAAWFDGACTRYGETGQGLLRGIRRRLWLYRFPILLGPWLPLHKRAANWLSAARWYRLRAAVRIRAYVRFHRGGAAGRLSVSPNPAPFDARGLATVTLEWTSTGAEATELRLSGPGGTLVSRTAGCGRTETGPWVSDGMTFFLQDASADKARTLGSTLDIARVRVKAISARTPRSNRSV